MSDDRGIPIDKRYLGSRDATSVMLGELLGKVDALRESARDRDRKLDVITENMDRLLGDFGRFEERYKGAHEALKRRVDELAEIMGTEEKGLLYRVRALEDARKGLRNLMLGASAVAGLGASKIWTLVTWFIDKVDH